MGRKVEATIKTRVRVEAKHSREYIEMIKCVRQEGARRGKKSQTLCLGLSLGC